jgi:lysophospholipase L1-like esterase
MGPPQAQRARSGEPVKVPIYLACLGDSLSTGFSVQPPLSLIWSARRDRNRGWFNSPSPEVDSVVDRLRRSGAVAGAANYSTVSAHAVSQTKRLLSHRLLGTRHLPEQVTRLLAARRLPNVVLIWIGHNDLDYIGVGVADWQEIAVRIAAAIGTQVVRLTTSDRFAVEPRLLVIFGLVDFARYFKARDQALQIHQNHPGAYPNFERCYSIFPSMLPQHREGMIQIAKRTNQLLAQVVAPLGGKCETIKVIYSDALYDTNIADAECLSPNDGWHPSSKGHSLFAHSAWNELSPLLPWISEPYA